MSNHLQNFIQDLQNKVIVNLEDEMFSPLSGRILLQLLFAPHPISLQQLADSLGVSKAAVSVQIRFLTSIGLCSKTSNANDRRHYYSIYENFSSKFLNILIEENRKSIQQIKKILEEFPPKEEIDEKDIPSYEIGKERFEEIYEFHKLFWERISDLGEVWEQKLKQLKKERSS